MSAMVDRLVRKTQYALEEGLDSLSTGEGLAVAMILNRSDWLAEQGYTLAQVLGRLEPEIIQAIPRAAEEVNAAQAATQQSKTRQPE